MELLRTAGGRGTAIVRLALLLLAGLIGAFHFAPAHARPAACSAGDNFCVEPKTTPWKFTPLLGFGINLPSPNFDSEAAAIAAIVARMQESYWCTLTLTSVTHDDNPAWGATPQYFGNIDIVHGNTPHFDVTGYSFEGCKSELAIQPRHTAMAGGEVPAARYDLCV